MTPSTVFQKIWYFYRYQHRIFATFVMSHNCDVEASDKSALQSSLGFNRAFIGNRTTVNANGRAAGASNLLPHDGHHEVLVQLELLTELRHFPELRKEGIVALNQKEQLTEVLRNIRRALLLPASAYLHLSYDTGSSRALQSAICVI